MGAAEGSSRLSGQTFTGGKSAFTKPKRIKCAAKIEMAMAIKSPR